MNYKVLLPHTILIFYGYFLFSFENYFFDYILCLYNELSELDTIYSMIIYKNVYYLNVKKNFFV